jgi:crotonobetainyl-CoA:carnitine CoA-transferase CaiB-like acyl-CoA transferase
MSVAQSNRTLAGLRVLNLSSSNLAGAMLGQFFADYGATVDLVEPKGGSPLRRQAGWPIWARGSRSIEADLDDPAVAALAAKADILIDTFRPGVLERHNLGHDQLAPGNRRLISVSITGFGRTGPYANLKAYEGVVMAKIGAYTQFNDMVNREGPAFATVPYCTISAAMLGFGGALAALYERETSGVGQRVETTLLQAIAAHDCWNWMITFLARKYPDAFQAVPMIDKVRRVPNAWVKYGMLQAFSADGRWLQFSQGNRRLFRKFLELLDLGDPKWEDAWEDEDLDRREAFWEAMLKAVRKYTVAEWEALFDQHPDVFAEVFRSDAELLDHPQFQFDDHVLTVDLPGLGKVREPKPFIRLSTTPGFTEGMPPALDEHAAALRADAATPRAATATAPSPPRAPALAGVKIIDLGNFYAAPYGPSMLADLGARVIKVEPINGDDIRVQVGMPQLGGVKVMQGKESIAINLATPEGREILARLVKDADVVMHNFRAGASKRLGVDEVAIRAANPDIIYHEAVGYGTAGPYGHRPAYAPTISAGSGMARRNVKSNIPEGPQLTLDQVKDGAIRMGAAALMVGHPDGFSAMGVMCAEALALLAKKRGMGGQSVVTTMMTTMAQVLTEDMIDYQGRPDAPTADPDLYGFGPLYRLYETAQGWVFLAAPTAGEWEALKEAMPGAGLDDAKFRTAEDRKANADALFDRLAAAFKTASAEDWERRLLEADVACVVSTTTPSHDTIMDPGGLGEQLGMVTTVEHGVFGEFSRLKSVIGLSRSATLANYSPLLGEHTAAVLAEHGYSDDEIADLAEREIVAFG